MADTVRRVIAEAALAKRFETEINERASLADIPALIDSVESEQTPGLPGSGDSSIAFDTDGVPYITIGE